MPYKIWAVNEILTAADMNTYVGNQTVMSFAGTAARTTAVGTPVEGMVSYLEDSDSIEVYTGTAVGWVHTASAGTPSYRFVETVQFTSSGTFTKADYPWLRAIKVTCVGGGGGGSGSNTDQRSGAGGGGGGTGIRFILATDLSATENVVVGAGGDGGVGGLVGTAGGTSSFASGETYGISGFGGGAESGGFGGAGGGAGGDIALRGGSGMARQESNANRSASQGGSSSLCGMSRASFTNTNRGGNNAEGRGGGGGGGYRLNAAVDGGDGGNGIVIVELYA